MKKINFLFAIILATTLSVYMFSCSGGDDEEKISFADVTLSHGNQYAIPNGKNLSWESSNELVAYVSNDTITAICVGTAIVKSSKGSFTVTVSPVYNNVTMPSLNFGASMSSIKTEMSSNTLVGSTTTSLLYNAPSPLKYYFLTFENGGMEYSSMLCTYANFTSVSNYIKERFVMALTDETSDGTSYAAGISADKKTMCIVSYGKLSGTYYYYFMFAENTTSSAKAISRATGMEIDKSVVEEMVQGKENLPAEAVDYLLKKKTRH